MPQNANPPAFQLSDDENAMKETEYLMSSKAMQSIILKGMEDAKNGNCEIVDIDKL